MFVIDGPLYIIDGVGVNLYVTKLSGRAQRDWCPSMGHGPAYTSIIYGHHGLADTQIVIVPRLEFSMK